ncbi:MAG: ABC transporter ATP-binding protein [Candidatus Wallbacteria bacterium]|nr:ABC transporter ATP-binding protein [Candidatus Wallbacteria bacterium]
MTEHASKALSSDRPHVPKSPDNPPVVVFQDVTKHFAAPGGGVFTAIERVSFTVEDIPGRGEFISILGPSGCGKSTILRILAGLKPSFPATAGTVTVKGQPVLAPGPDRGMVFQSYSSYPCYTVLENVALGLRLKGMEREEREEIARHWIRRVRLAGSEHKYPHELSGGMQQRVAIARTLAVEPRIILMDEPFGALDRITRWEMQDLIVELWSNIHATVFLITHDIPEAVHLGDRIFIMSPSPGRLIEEIHIGPPTGPAAEVQRTADFTALANEISRKVEKAG